LCIKQKKNKKQKKRKTTKHTEYIKQQQKQKINLKNSGKYKLLNIESIFRKETTKQKQNQTEQN